jgi:hypothetical protein
MLLMLITQRTYLQLNWDLGKEEVTITLVLCFTPLLTLTDLTLDRPSQKAHAFLDQEALLVGNLT